MLKYEYKENKDDSMTRLKKKNFIFRNFRGQDDTGITYNR